MRLVVIDFEAPAGGRTRVAAFFVGFGKGTGAAWFDDLKIEEVDASKAPRLEGDYLSLDLVQVAAGLGARACRATTAAELRESLSATRGHPGPVVIVVPVIPHADLPGAGVWWDVAPAEVSTLGVTAGLRAEYDSDIKEQRWFG